MKGSLKFVTASFFSVMMLLVVAAQAAFADPRDFTIENDSFSYIYEVYVAPSSSSYWGRDLLGSGVLGPGERENITFNPAFGNTCYYDILVVNGNGLQTRKNYVNLCRVDVEYYTE
jgi:hypothetical protein